MFSYTMLIFLVSFLSVVLGQDVNKVKFLFVIEKDQKDFTEWFQNSLGALDVDSEILSVDTDIVVVDHEDGDTNKICNSFSKGSTFIIDVTWTGNEETNTIAKNLNVPYIRIDLSISPVLELLDKFLNLRNSSDIVVIFEDPKYIDQALYYWLDTALLRMVISDKLDRTAAQKLKNMRPMPNNYAIISSTNKMAEILNTAIYANLTVRPERWNLIFLDFAYNNFLKDLRISQINLLKMQVDICCQLQDLVDCNCPGDFNLQQSFFNLLFSEIVHTLTLMADQKLPEEVACSTKEYNDSVAERFNELFGLVSVKNGIFWESNRAYRLKIDATVEVVTGFETTQIMAKYDENQELVPVDGVEIKAVKPFYRIGTTHAIPWSFQAKDPKTGQLRWTGYCIDLVEELSKMLNFDYELVVPKNGTFGQKDKDGKWDGLIGDVARGEIEMAVSALIMTADREEVVDFIVPYFDQSGISIVMRKPVHKTSLFKFMTVLKLEVWLSIVAALVITAFMIWFLDKYSPYSAKNNKRAYPYETRDFTLKESFWFALTSFTPQGGGEAPKSLSARTLVAAYWLFVVLMLATFTANLAAFLTVERMQTPVQSLEQLAKQSRINYTVVESSDTHQYFINMKFAEDTLYRMWKELTLNASTDDIRYRVWDYPIREQYGHILLSINESIPVANASEGFRIVNERLDGDFAFIHDSSEVKYEISRNCNFTEVGEVFAEKPYSIAIQQGSMLHDEISIKILDLQKDRFFEYLQSKYWNNSVRGECSNDIDSEGITLESLGGVFIATLFGLGLAMVTLAGEVLYYKRKDTLEKTKKNKTKHEKRLSKTTKVYPDSITIGTTFKPLRTQNMTPKISYLSVYPRKPLHNN